MSELEEPKPMDLNGQKRWEGGGREGGSPRKEEQLEQKQRCGKE